MNGGGDAHLQVGDAFVVGNGYYSGTDAGTIYSNALRVTYKGDILGTKAFQCGQEGIATLAEKRDFDTFYVLERISENVVSVLI